MKKLFAVAAMAASSLAYAHGAHPKHGGIVSSAADLAFELVQKDGKVVVYVEDHGREVSTRDAKGSLTVLQGTDKTATTLEPSEHNTLTSKADVKWAKGAKAVASITLAGKEPISVRFSAR